jgi:uncharacterized protein (DUF1015 family)
MVEIIPFRGIRYNPEEVVDLTKVVSPPYDVISDGARNEYYKKHEKNIIRIILGKDRKGDTGDTGIDDRYTKAASYLKSWLHDGTLIQDKKPSIYLYGLEYAHGKDKRVMKGFVALTKLEEFDKGIIFPHEETLKGPIKDRLELLRKCNANFSQIFMLYSDPAFTVETIYDDFERREPLIDIEVDRVRHRLWKINGEDTINKIVDMMKDKKSIIADGHHRYTTALCFRDETKSPGYGCSYDYRAAFFTNTKSRGITILPAHRLVRNVHLLDPAISEFGKYFDVEEMSTPNEMFDQLKRGKSVNVFGMYLNSKYYAMTLKDGGIIETQIDAKRTSVWKRLDVTVLHYLIIEGILKVESDGRDVRYEIDGEKAVDLVDRGEYQVALFLNPTKVRQVEKIAFAGEKMPGKATFFYPKLLSGFLMNKMDR